jgi:hypothetical protein
MKYCKSKRGYFYKVVGDKKTRISMDEYKAGFKKLAMKGGFTEDGNVEPNDFDIYANFNSNPSKYEKELPDSSQISILYNRNGIPYVFFDQNHETNKYRYVMFYNESDGKIPYIIKEIKKNGTILDVELREDGRYRIADTKILFLCNKILEEYEKNKSKRTEEMKKIVVYLHKLLYNILTKNRYAFCTVNGSSSPYKVLADEVMRKFNVLNTE